MDIIFLDTETTDIDESSRLVQLAYKNPATGVVVNEYFKAPGPISFGAMAIHHITNEMVADKPAFAESPYRAQLADELARAITVAHNATFDINILKKEGIEASQYIDTLRVARHVLESPQYSLQYLRYSLGVQVEGVAHDALGDILVLEALFAHLKKVVAEKYGLVSDEEVVQKMIELTQTPAILKNIRFGKYNGKTFEEVAAMDRGYLEWLLGSESQKPEGDQNQELIHTLKHFCK